MSTIQTRIPDELAQKLDAAVKQLQKQTPAATVTRASVIRAALEEYLKFLEEDESMNEQTRIPIHGGKVFDLLEDGDFVAYEYEITGPNSIRFYGEYKPIEGEARETTMSVLFKDDIEGMTQEEILGAAWDEAQVE